jgi:hypothetical protein
MRRLLAVCALAVIGFAASRSSFVDLMQRGAEQGRQAGWDLLIGDVHHSPPGIGSTVLLDYSERAKALALAPAPRPISGGSCRINWKQSAQGDRGYMALTLNSLCINDVDFYDDHGTEYVVYSVWNPFVSLTDRCFRVKAPPKTDPPTLVRLNYSFTYDVRGADSTSAHKQRVELLEQDNPELDPNGPHSHISVSVVSGAEVGLWADGVWTPLQTKVVADEAWAPACTLIWAFTWSIVPKCWGDYGKYALWLDDLTFCNKVIDASTLYRRNWRSTPAPGFWVEGTKTGTIGLWGPSYDTTLEVKQACQPPSS